MTVSPDRGTPQPWAVGTEPSIQQLTHWLRACTMEELEQYAGWAQEAGAAEERCFREHHRARLADAETAVADALAAQHRAERMTGRLLSLLVLSEAREARQRGEIGDLEARLGRSVPTWEST